MKFDASEQKVLTLLASSVAGLHVYTLFRHAGLSTQEMARSLGRLKNRHAVSEQGNIYQLTEFGRKLISTGSTEAHLPPHSQRTLKPPAFGAGPRIGINEFYLPRHSELPASLKRKLASDQ